MKVSKFQEETTGGLCFWVWASDLKGVFITCIVSLGFVLLALLSLMRAVSLFESEPGDASQDKWTVMRVVSLFESEPGDASQDKWTVLGFLLSLL